MKTTIHFTKMSGAGNDFVVIDNREDSLQVDKPKLAVALCSRHFGVGADGLLLLEASSSADFSMRYYNADGSYSGMCGNGGRCIARYAFINGIAASRLRFEALDYIYSAEVIGTTVKLHMKKPHRLQFDMLVSTRFGEFKGHFVNTGSPHFVCESPKLDTIAVQAIGKEIRYHPLFAPEGCNVNFVKIAGNDELQIRTYERGVEAETLACGTGSVASAIISAHRHQMNSPTTVNVKSGEQVKVYFDFDGREFKDIVLEGSAHIIFVGYLLYDTETHEIQDSVDVAIHNSPVGT